MYSHIERKILPWDKVVCIQTQDSEEGTTGWNPVLFKITGDLRKEDTVLEE